MPQKDQIMDTFYKKFVRENAKFGRCLSEYIDGIKKILFHWYLFNCDNDIFIITSKLSNKSRAIIKQ